MKKSFFLILLAVTIVPFGCNKRDESTPDILTAKTWKRATQDKNPSSNPGGDVIYYAVKDCEKDDRFKFSVHGQLTIDQGSQKCDPDESEIVHLNYTLNRETKELVIDGIAYTLAEESADQIKYYTVIPATTSYLYVIYLLQ